MQSSNTAETVENDHLIKCFVAGNPIKLMIDSGSSVNTVHEKFYEKILKIAKDRILTSSTETNKNLFAYAGASPLEIVAKFRTDLFIDDIRPHGLETFYVIKQAKQGLLGRHTSLRYSVLQLGIDVRVPKSIQILSVISSNQSTFPKFNLPPVKLVIDESVKPRRFTYTNIPFAYSELTRKRLDEMLRADIIEELTSDMDRKFCSALLVVPKGKTDVRLVVDLRGANKSVIREPHNMPSIETVMSKLHGNVKFSTIDLSSAFSHVELHESSRHVTNFYSGEKFYRFKRLPFGLCNAPDIFQLAMETILEGCKGLVIYLDDILIFGKTAEEHDENLKKVLNRLNLHNVKLNRDKCNLNQTSCTFLGFKITPNGYQVTKERVEAIKNFRRPENISELRSFLGLMNYVDRFIVNRVDRVDILQSMVRSKTFQWTDEANLEFEYMRNKALESIKTLGYFSQSDRTELVVDASPVGLGAVLVQYNYADRPRIIACVSKSLTSAEKRYPQVHKEALALVWGIDRLKFFLRGISFTVLTDAAANEYIFGSDYRMGKRAIQRAESWSLKVLPYSFTVKTVQGRDNIADALSRLIKDSQIDNEFDTEIGEAINVLSLAEEIPITREEIEKETEQDPILKNVIIALESNRWAPGLKSYQSLQKHLYIVGGCLILRDKMIVPSSLRDKILKLVHRGHFGINSMKRTLRTSVWWPGMNSQVEDLVKRCTACQLVARAPKPLPIQSRDLPEGPWQVIQIDFLKLPKCGTEEFFMITDTFSRMFWCVEMNRTDASSTKKALWDIFKIWGKVDIIQSDNGPPFNSEDFTSYWRKHGITHRTVVPYCPFMNGMVERRNEGVIRAIKTALTEGRNWRDALQEYVMKYNNVVPHSSTGATPFELMTGRKFKGFLPSCFNSSQVKNNSRDFDDVRASDALSKLRSKSYADCRRGAKNSDVKEGDWVLVANKNRRDKLDTTFLQEKFLVIHRDRQKVTVKSEKGKVYNRYVGDVRIFSERKSEDKTITADSEISIGDIVTFSKGKPMKGAEKSHLSQRFKVLIINGDSLVIVSEDGAELTVHHSDVKQVPETKWSDLKPPPQPTDGFIDKEPRSEQKNESLDRPKREKLPPKKLQDYKLYNIYG